MNITFRLPLPPPKLRSNKRGHWATREKARNDYRAETAVAIHPFTQDPKSWGFPWEKVTAYVEFTFPDWLERDAANYLEGLKSAFDILQERGVIKDDDWKHFSLVLLPPKVSRAGAGVEIRLEREEALK